MRIAIPSWAGRVSPVFDTAARLVVFQIEEAEEIDRFETLLDEQDLVRRSVRIRGLGVNTLICGAISKHFHQLLDGAGICIIPWISGEVSEVLSAYLQGTLSDARYRMPGCGGENLPSRASPSAAPGGAGP